MSAGTASVLSLITGAALIVAGVHILIGTGPALMAAGAAFILFGIIIAAGARHG